MCIVYIERLISISNVGTFKTGDQFLIIQSKLSLQKKTATMYINAWARDSQHKISKLYIRNIHRKVCALPGNWMQVHYCTTYKCIKYVQHANRNMHRKVCALPGNWMQVHYCTTYNCIKYVQHANRNIKMREELSQLWSNVQNS